MSVSLPVSLRTLRSDTGLAANGGMRDRQLLNRQMKGSGSVSLAAFHNTINGFQREWDSYGSLTTGKTGPVFYLDNNYTTGSSYTMSGNQVTLTAYCYGNGAGDIGTEARVNGIFSHGGQFVNASCSTDGTSSSPDVGVGYGQLSLVASLSGGYLYGTVNVIKSMGFGNGSRGVSLRSDDALQGGPYHMTLVGYAFIMDGYGQFSQTQRFRDMKMGLG